MTQTDACRLLAPDDLRAVHAVLDGAFADHWDHRHEPFEHWAEDRAHGPDYDPDLWRLAWEGASTPWR